MISFRYHLVSIVAVFAALAVGIIAGSTVVKQSLLDSTEQNLDRTERQLAEISDARDELNSRVDRYEDFGAASMMFLDGRLGGTPLVVVSGPEVDGEVSDGVTEAIDAAGGEVVGRLRIDSTIADDDAPLRLAGALDSSSPDVRQLRAELGRRVGVGIRELAESIEGSVERQAEEDARSEIEAPDDTVVAAGDEAVSATVTEPPVAATAEAVVDTTIPTEGIDPTSGDPSVDSSPVTTTTVAPTTTTTAVPLEVDPSVHLGDDVLRSLDRANLVRIDDVADEFVPTHRLVVLVITDRRSGVPVADVVAALLTALVGRDDDDPVAVVLAEAGEVPGDDETTSESLVGAVRDDGDLRDAVSTVDDAEEFPGWIATVLTLEERGEGRVGHYGRHDGSRGLFPSAP